LTTKVEQKKYANSDTQRLFFAIAEQMKQPLMQISRGAELGVLTKDLNHFKTIEHASDSVLHLLDSYMLSMQLHDSKDMINLVPVSLSAILQDIAHTMQSIAAAHQCDLELHVAGKYGPIMAHPAGLQAALKNIGRVFIDVQSQRIHTRRPVIMLAAHRTRYGITAGMFSDIEGLNTDMLRKARQLYGKARQPLAQLSSTNGAEVFVADSLLDTMSSGLRVARFQKLTGLAATFTPSKQLSLV
jgi:hypothetical protein